MNTELLSIKDAAKVLKLHPNHVSRLCKQGTLPSERVGACYVIRAEVLDAFRQVPRPTGRPRKNAEVSR